MSALSAEQRAKLRADTLPACGPFLEDMAYVRAFVTAGNPSPAEIRRLSAILRRLLNERAIPIIGAPRYGKIKLPEPDNKPIYKSAETQPYAFFLSAGATAYGATFRALSVTNAAYRHTPVVGMEPGRTVNVPVENFLDQPVLCFQGVWLKRRAAIKYIANVASGVHAGVHETPDDDLAGKIRRCVTIRPRVIDGAIGADINVRLDAIDGKDSPVKYDAEAIDPVLLEVLSAAHFLTESDDVRNLEDLVAAELGQPAPKRT